MTNKILISGGSGFIGNQVAHELHKQGHEVTVVDRKVKHWDTPFTVFEDDFLNFIAHTDSEYDTIIHLAADHLVEQSVAEPSKYYMNNVIKMKGMLDHMVAKGISNIIFSSTGAVYGRQGNGVALTENLHYDPENTYASTKVAGEMMIRDYAKAFGIKYVNFRYFNVAGADPDNKFGYIQRPATHVIPILCNKILNEETFEIYGSDYETKDGTCVRDYVHVADLASAHAKAIEYLNNGNENETFNIGCGSGISVKELVECAASVVGKKPIVEYNDRRQGDSMMLVADISKAQKVLNWTPKYSLKDSILHAWKWETKLKANLRSSEK